MKKKLTNPFVLGLQGFVAGAILFWGAQAARPDYSSTSEAMTPTERSAAF